MTKAWNEVPRCSLKKVLIKLKEVGTVANRDGLGLYDFTL